MKWIKFSNEKNESDDIYSWCLRNKMTIDDETLGKMTEYTDTHPGYFGHIEYAKKLAEFMNWPTKKIKNKLI